VENDVILFGGGEKYDSDGSLFVIIPILLPAGYAIRVVPFPHPTTAPALNTDFVVVGC